jgi:hypothetical protein
MLVRSFASTTIGVAGVMVAAAALGAQAAPQRRSVSRMEVEYADPFTCVQWGQIRELSDGRLIVADPTEKRVELINLRGGAPIRIGRQGAGPGEWGVPMGLVPLPGDTTLLNDPQNNRLLKILPDGRVVEEPIRLGTVGGGGMMISIGGPRGYDRMGRLYSQGSPVRFTPGQAPQAADSVPITRFDPRTARTDTIAFIPTLRPDVQTSPAGGRGMSVSIRLSPNPFAPLPTWAVTPDGRVAVVTPEPYRIEWIAANRSRVTGPAVSYDRVRVTEADRTSTRPPSSCSISISRGSPAGGGGGTEIRMGGGGLAAGAAGAATAARGQDRTDWPEFKPPFVGGAAAVVATPTGEIWVQRSRAAGDDIPTYDVFDGRGQLVSRVALPKGARLLGFGSGTLYLSRTDADDLVYIQRWSLDTP